MTTVQYLLNNTIVSTKKLCTPIIYIMVYITVFLLPNYTTAQEIPPDSLLSKSYKELKANLDKLYIDTIPDIAYAKAYLYKAKQGKDTIHMANAYFYLSRTHTEPKSVIFLDSLIDLTKNSKHKNYPSLGYLQRGILLYDQGKFKEALNWFLIALDDAEKKKNIIYALTIKTDIGLLKNNLGEYKEGLKIFREYVDYLDKVDIEHKNLYYIQGLNSLANSYIYNKKYDSASYAVDRGLRIALKEKDTLMYASYVLTSGINLYYLGNYKKAIDSLSKAVKLHDQEEMFVSSNIYIGKTLLKIGKVDEAISRYEKVDSVIKITQNIAPQLIDPYKTLVNYFEKKGDIKKQLYYVNALIKYDSILNSNNNYLIKEITKNYEIPQYLQKKELLIEQLQEEKHIFKNTNIILYIISSLLLLIAGIFVKRNLSYRKRFESLMAKIEEEETQEETSKPEPIGKEEIKKKKPSVASTIDLSEEFIADVLKGLDTFEKSGNFTKNKYTLHTLAKELNTNSVYLSKIINSTKEINFTNYLNNLRVDFAVKKLKEDKRFRAFTIKAIAEEVGFNSAQTFSAAFRKKTGIYPSYFVKQLESYQKA